MARKVEKKAKRTVQRNASQSLLLLRTGRVTATKDEKTYDYRTQRYCIPTLLRAPSESISLACKRTNVCSKCKAPMYSAIVYIVLIFRLDYIYFSFERFVANFYFQLNICSAFVFECFESYLSTIVGYSYTYSRHILYNRRSTL